MGRRSSPSSGSHSIPTSSNWKFLKSKPITWPQLHEAGGLDGRLAEELGVLTLPTMILLDAEGKVVDRNVVITELEKKVDALLEGK